MYLYVDRAVTEEDFYSEFELKEQQPNIVISDAVKSEIAFKIINNALNKIINPESQNIEVKKDSIFQKSMNFLSSFFNTGTQESIEFKERLRRLKHIREMRPHLFVDFLNDDQLNSISKSLNFKPNSREQLVANLENYLLESKVFNYFYLFIILEHYVTR